MSSKVPDQERPYWVEGYYGPGGRNRPPRPGAMADEVPLGP